MRVSRTPNPPPPGCLREGALLRAIARDVKRVPPAPSQSLAISYPEFLAFFGGARTLTRHHLVIGASFSYAWMPTILEFRSTSLDLGVEALTRARSAGALMPEDMLCLSEIVNNSIVGASKLLQFAAPEAFAIWDSRVAKYLGTSVFSRERGVAQYLAYNACIRSLAATSNARAIARTVARSTGTATHTLRALELVMYTAGVAGYTHAQ